MVREHSRTHMRASHSSAVHPAHTLIARWLANRASNETENETVASGKLSPELELNAKRLAQRTAFVLLYLFDCLWPGHVPTCSLQCVKVVRYHVLLLANVSLIVFVFAWRCCKIESSCGMAPNEKERPPPDSQPADISLHQKTPLS